MTREVCWPLGTIKHHKEKLQMKRKILILGGTEFVGRQLVEKLSKEEKNDIYLFNRGKTNSKLFPKIKKIIGDRETKDIQKIGLYKWDYIIDFSSYYPDSLEQTLRNINKDVKKYIYISTISVYSFKDYDTTHKIKEDFKKKNYEIHQLRERSLKYYGEKKSACEDILNKKTWLNSIILRPSIIYGKFDPTDRLYYWIERIKKRNKIILPENGEHLISLTYSFDLVEIIVHGLNSQFKNGTYNCVSDKPLRFKEILEEVKNQLKSKCEFIPIESDKLIREKLSAQEFPFWWGANIIIDNSKLNSSLDIEFVSVNDSIKSTIEYYENQGWPNPKIGISYKKEDQLIEKLNTVPNKA